MPRQGPGPASVPRETPRQEPCRRPQIAQIISPRGISRVCLTPASDRFPSPGPAVPWAFLEKKKTCVYKADGRNVQGKYIPEGRLHGWTRAPAACWTHDGSQAFTVLLSQASCLLSSLSLPHNDFFHKFRMGTESSVITRPVSRKTDNASSQSRTYGVRRTDWRSTCTFMLILV